jgi:pimeloyl-ACP methyl ester carboxylesterase
LRLSGDAGRLAPGSACRITSALGNPVRPGVLAIVALILLLHPPGAAFACQAGTDPAAPAGAPPAAVYVFRAIGGKFVSREMDDLAARIEACGFAVGVYNYTGWISPARRAVARYRSETVKSRIIAVGWSAGGDSAIRFALSLKRAGVPVDLIVTLDPTRIANRVPSNVGRFINIYNSAHAFGGGNPSPASDFKGHFASVDLRNYSDIWHLYLPRMKGLQDLILAKIVEVAATAAPSPGPAVPIEYTPPPDTPMELWDSGAAVVAEAGETAADVAAQFGVPVWVVAEINKLDANRPLAAGQRLVVPRYISAVTPAQ